VELSYFDILFEDKVVELSSHGLLNVLLDADQYGSYLNLAPTLGQVNQALAIPGLLLLDFNDPPGFDPADIRGILSLGYTNAASVQPKGVDGAVQYTWETGIGAFHTDVAATYFTSYETKFAPTAAPNSGLDRVAEPPRFRGRAQLSWSAASLSAYARVNYTKGYHNQLDQSCGELGCPIDSYATMDAGVAYTTSESSSELISGLRIGLDISNLFDEDPPYVSILDNHYDGANADPLGRAFAVTVTKKW
jgi:iron complex outermembrane receptor protein